MPCTRARTRQVPLPTAPKCARLTGIYLPVQRSTPIDEVVEERDAYPGGSGAELQHRGSCPATRARLSNQNRAALELRHRGTAGVVGHIQQHSRRRLVAPLCLQRRARGPPVLNPDHRAAAACLGLLARIQHHRCTASVARELQWWRRRWRGGRSCVRCGGTVDAGAVWIDQHPHSCIPLGWRILRTVQHWCVANRIVVTCTTLHYYYDDFDQNTHLTGLASLFLFS